MDGARWGMMGHGGARWEKREGGGIETGKMENAIYLGFLFGLEKKKKERKEFSMASLAFLSGKRRCLSSLSSLYSSSSFSSLSSFPKQNFFSSFGGGSFGRLESWKRRFYSKQTVAIIGRPNVGKSSLFNSLIERRRALVSEKAGTTRDRGYGECTWRDRTFKLVDTGGILGDEELATHIQTQALFAVEEAEIILFVVDVTDGISPKDKQISQMLRKHGKNKKVIVVVNKVDNSVRERDAEQAIFARLGPYPVVTASAIHRIGFQDILDAVIERLPPPCEEEEREMRGEEENEDDVVPFRVSIVGRPNVGKSTLINQLTGGPRSVVDSLAGTTRDPVDSLLSWEETISPEKPFVKYKIWSQPTAVFKPQPAKQEKKDKKEKKKKKEEKGEEGQVEEAEVEELEGLELERLRGMEEGGEGGVGGEVGIVGDKRKFEITLVDTAGIRRRSNHQRDLEHLSTMWALRAVEDCDLAVLVLDGQDGITSQDKSILTEITDQFRSCIVVVNKWDTAGKDGRSAKNRDDYETFLRSKLGGMHYVDIVFLSAKMGTNVNRLVPMLVETFMNRQLRLSVSDLNNVIKRAQVSHQSPARGKKSFKIRFAVQARTTIPTFVFFVNKPGAIHFSFKRYLENTIRDYFGAFRGTPLRLLFRHSKDSKDNK